MNGDKESPQTRYEVSTTDAQNGMVAIADSSPESITNIRSRIERIAYLMGRNAAIMDAKETIE